MMTLRELLTQVSAIKSLPDHPVLDQEIKSIATNSHACGSGSLFLGMPGTRVDGGEFCPSAIESGAIAFWDNWLGDHVIKMLRNGAVV